MQWTFVQQKGVSRSNFIFYTNLLEKPQIWFGEMWLHNEIIERVMDHFVRSSYCCTNEGAEESESTHTETRREEVKEKINGDPACLSVNLVLVLSQQNFCIFLFLFNFLGA